MSYLQFHLLFTLPWLALLLVGSVRAVRAGRPLAGRLVTAGGVTAGDVAVGDVAGREGAGREGAGDYVAGTRFARWALIAHLVIAFVYTTPWDNYLVARGVWGYPPGRVLATIGWVPIEEYAFFLIQTAATGLLLFWLLRARPWRRFGGPLPEASIRWGGAALLLVIAALGATALAWERGTYAGLIIAWAFPVLALQWGFGGDLLIRRWRLVTVATFLPTAWLWLADRIAIGQEVWWISEHLTTGLKAFGLPVEEALFFLVTNLLVVFGLTMALDPVAAARGRGLWVRRAEAWRIALLGWAVSMVPAPLLPDRFAELAYLSTGLLTLGLLGYALQRYGARAWLVFAVSLGFGVAIEAVGARTGVPFGTYVYTAPGPALLGVPLLVPLGWFAFTLVALAAAPVRGRAWLAPLALVAWDLGLDPLMVDRGFWRFEQADWFGVPVSNFVGWYLAGRLLVELLTRLVPELRHDAAPVLRGVFAVQAAMMGLGLAMFGLPLAGAVAAAAMAGFALLSWPVRAARPAS